MPTRRTAAAVLATAVGMTGVVTACTPESSQPSRSPVTIGILANQDSRVGVAAIQAATLAVDLVNDRHPELGLPATESAGVPGLGGRPVRLAAADSTGQPGAGESAMVELLAEPQLAGVVAAEGAEVIATAGAYADRREVPLVDAVSSADFLREVGLDWYFRVSPSDRRRAEAVLTLLATELGPGASNRITVLGGADGDGADLVAALPELARGSGLEVTATVPLDAPEQLAQTAGEPVVAVAATVDQARRLEQVLAGSAGARPVAAIGGGFGPDRYAGPAGTFHPAGWSTDFSDRHPLASSVTDLYRQRYQEPMTEPAAAAFTAVLALVLAIDRAGAVGGAAVRAGLRQLAIPATETIMPWNGIRFAPDGENEWAAAVVDQHTGDGWQLVYPPELAVTNPDWPAPPAEGVP